MTTDLRKDKAFTLIELLVVVAIIALLLSIVMPGLKRARQVAERVVCGSQLSQIGLAFEMYQMNHNNRRFVIRSSTTDYKEQDLNWMGKIAEYIGEGHYGEVYRQGETIDALLCPTTPAKRFRSDDAVLTNPAGQWGTVNEPWEWDRGSGLSTLGGYAINSFIGYDVFYEDEFDTQLYKEWLRMSPNVPLFADALWLNAYPQGSNPVPAHLQGPQTTTESVRYQDLETHMWRMAIERHGRQNNILYRDMHVSSVRLEDMWYQPWHRNYQYPAGPIQLPSR